MHVGGESNRCKMHNAPPAPLLDLMRVAISVARAKESAEASGPAQFALRRRTSRVAHAHAKQVVAIDPTGADRYDASANADADEVGRRVAVVAN